MKVKNLISFVVILAFCVNACQLSAIPMWEYLSRDEKMSMLFNMFSKQVQSYCKTKNGDVENISECKRNMMTYGVVKLNDMEDTSLDQMDPYQRNADTILWDSMMNGHSTEMRDERQEYLQNEQIRQQNQLHKGEPTLNEEVSEKSSPPSFDEDDEMANFLHDGAATSHNFAYVNKPDDLDNHRHLEQNTNYLTGPMVSYMMPDGSPVKNAVQYMPIDEDREDMEMMKKKMPSMQELYAMVETMDEKPKIIIAQVPTTTTISTEKEETSNIESSSIAPSRTPRIFKTISGAYRVH